MLLRAVGARRAVRIGVAFCVLVAGVGTLGPARVQAGASGTAVVQAPTTYTNPLGNGLTAAPSVTKAADGAYYAYVSGFDFHMPFPVFALRSTDLATWTHLGGVLPGGAPWADNASGHNFSSPAVRHVPSNPTASRYVMAFTAKTSGSTDRCIGIANASSPGGPFTANATPLICPPGGAQDPSFLALPDNVPFQEIFYKRNGADAGIYNQVVTQNGQSLHPDWAPILLYRAQPTWWHQGVVERPTIASEGGKAYLFFSGAPANTKSRAIGWSVCQGGYGIVLTCKNQTQLGTFVASTAQVESPSGPQVFSDGANQWLAYDGLAAGSCPASGQCGGSRTMRLDKLCFAHGQPRTNAPSSGPQTLARNATCSDDVPAPAVAIAQYIDTGTTQMNALDGQDGGNSTAAGGRSLWFFGDTFKCGGITNSGAMGVPAPSAPNAPNWIDEPGCATQLVPYTAEELAYNEAHKCNPGCTTWSRVMIWPGNVVGLTAGDAVAVFSKGINTCNWVGPPTNNWNCFNFVDNGTGIARISAASIASGTPVASRDPAVSPSACNPTCLFPRVQPNPMGTYRVPVLDGDFLYLYTASTPWRVARARLESIHSPGAWTFWTGQPAPNDWSTLEGQGVAPSNFIGGKVYYSPYLDRFINVGQDFVGGLDVALQTATNITGPWSSPIIVGPMPATCPNRLFPYSLTAHPELAMDGGRTLGLTYVRPGNGSCEHLFPWATVKFQ